MLKFCIRMIFVLSASLIATHAVSQDLSGWSDKTVCRLASSQQDDPQYLQEAKNRGLSCGNATLGDKSKSVSTCAMPIQSKLDEGMSKNFLDVELSSFFGLPIISHLPRFMTYSDGDPIPLSKGEWSSGSSIKLIADFNNDGLDDIMLGQPMVNMPPIFLISNGDGTFKRQKDLPQSFARHHFRKAVAADFNNDGFIDVVGFTTGSPHKPKGWVNGGPDILLMNVNGKTFREVTIPEWNKNEYNHGGGAADIDGDGFVDILPVSADSDLRSGPLRNVGNDIFKKGKTPYSSLVTKEMSSSLATGDLNKDGYIDLVFAISPTRDAHDVGFRNHNLNSNTVQIIYGDGDFNFNNNRRLSFGRHWLTPDQANKIREEREEHRAADNPWGGKKKTLFGAGTSNVELADINNDGLLDIVAGYWFAPHELQMSSGFKVFINQGDCFSDQTSNYFPNQRMNREVRPGKTSSYIHQFYFQDISGDTLPDLILKMDGYMDYISSEEPYSPSIFINNGSNIYLPLLKEKGPKAKFEGNELSWDNDMDFSASLKTGFHSLGDFDGDGRSDFVFIKKDFHKTQIHVLLQRSKQEKEFEMSKKIERRNAIIQERAEASRIKKLANLTKLKIFNGEYEVQWYFTGIGGERTSQASDTLILSNGDGKFSGSEESNQPSYDLRQKLSVTYGPNGRILVTGDLDLFDKNDIKVIHADGFISQTHITHVKAVWGMGDIIELEIRKVNRIEGIKN